MIGVDDHLGNSYSYVTSHNLSCCELRRYSYLREQLPVALRRNGDIPLLHLNICGTTAAGILHRDYQRVSTVDARAEACVPWMVQAAALTATVLALAITAVTQQDAVVVMSAHQASFQRK